VITHIRFRSPVTLGTECSEWSLARPSSSSYANKIAPRVGDPVLGERFESIVFEVRIGAESAWHNVEVPMSNISSIVRTVGGPPVTEPTAAQPAPEPVKLQPTKAK
jgi:hypothetical protein